MNRTVTGSFVLAFAVALSGAAHSAAVIDLSWNACSPIVHDRILPPGATTSDLYVLGSGITGTTDGYEVWIFMGQNVSANCSPRVVADAWRFDAAGCQGPSFFNVSLSSASKSCPSLKGDPSFSSFLLEYDTSVGQLVFRATVAYGGSPQLADPNLTYLLARLTFDHTYAVSGPGDPPNTCGGFEKSMCFTLWGGSNVKGDCFGPGQIAFANYERTDGSLIPFGPGPVNVTSFRTDPGIAACEPATPVHATTWGAVRGMYR